VKTRKLLSLVLALVMVLSVVSFAGAATFTDVDDADLDAVVTRLAGLKILDGYPDGTFKPDNTITRAEFATIAVRALGLHTTADLLANVPSKFSDVKVTDWFNKYVNVATSQGILKGYPDGTFKPNNNITQAEALTIVLRLLGYNDNLSGNWPYNYVMQADMLGLITSDFAANTAATRGGIAALIYDALEEDVVRWDGEKGFVSQEKTLLAKQLNATVSDLLDVESVSTGGKTYYTLTAGGTTHNVAKDVKVSGSTFAGLANHKVVLTKVKNVVVAVEVKSTLVSGTVKKVAGRVVTIGSTEVTFGSGVNMTGIAKDKVVSAWIYDGKAYKAIVHAKDQTDIIASKGTDTTGPYVIFKADSTKKVYFTSNAVITLNGAAATFANLAAGQFASYELDDSTPAEITKLDAFSKTVEGKVDSWKSAGGYYSYITIDGVEYKVAAEAVPTTQSIVLGANAVLTLNTNNEVVAVVQSAQYATAVIGEFDSLYSQATAAGTKYFITLKDGVSYDITDVKDTIYKNLEHEIAKVEGEDVAVPVTYAFNQLTQNMLKDSTIKIQYNAAGKVTRVDVFSDDYELVVADLEDLDDVWDGNWDSDTNGNSIPDLIEALAGLATTYSTNGVGHTADFANAIKFVITWNVNLGYASNVNAVTVAEDEPIEGEVTDKGTDFAGSFIWVEEEGSSPVKYYLTSAVISMFDEIGLGDKVEFEYYTNQAGINFITEIEITEKAPVDEDEPTPPAPETVTFKGQFTLDGNTYVQLDDVIYPYVGGDIDAGIEENDTVIATFGVIRGETVVTKLKEVTP